MGEPDERLAAPSARSGRSTRRSPDTPHPAPARAPRCSSRFSPLDDVVRIEAADDDHHVVAGPLGERDHLGMRRVVEVDVAELLQGRVLPSQLVQPAEQQAEVLALLLGGGPVPRPELILLRIEVFLAPRTDRGVLEEFVAGVDAPGRRQGCRQDRPDRERRLAAVLQIGGQDVRGVDEEVRPEEAVSVSWLSSVRYSSSSDFLVAPGEVRVRLLENRSWPSRCIIGGLVNASARKITSGSVRRNLGLAARPRN